MTASRRKGSGWETAIVDYLRANGVPHTERRVTNGAKDRGDIAGIPGVVIEAKNAARVELAAWLDEAEAERRNDMSPVGVVWHKRKGKASPGQGFVTMSGSTLLDLLRMAGYIPETAPGGAAIDSPPPGAATQPPEWAVDHPGLGIYAYESEYAARVAAGTAGTLLHHGQAVD